MKPYNYINSYTKRYDTRNRDYTFIFLQGDTYMVLTGFEWLLIGGAASMAIGLIGFFLKRTMSRVDCHETDITNIKLTYVTRNDLEKMEGELKSNIRQLNDSMSEIKERVLYRDDFYRTIVDVNRNIEKLQDLFIEEKRGGRNDAH